MNREAFEHFMTAPGMYVGYPTYERIVVWLHGVDFGTNGQALLGFQEWVFTRLGDRLPTGWPGAVEQCALQQFGRTFVPNKSEDDEIRVQHLFRLLREYLNDRYFDDGLKKIYVRYQRMLESRDIYDAAMDGVD